MYYLSEFFSVSSHDTDTEYEIPKVNFNFTTIRITLDCK